MKLRDVQLGMARALRRESSLGDLPDERAFASRVARGNARLAPDEQLDIYREQFFLRHVDAVAEDFEAVVAVLGWDTFEAVTRRFLAKHPPDMFSLNDLGARFAEHVGHSRVPHKALVGELARLEWAFIEAFFSAEKPPLDPARLAAAAERLDDARVVFDDTLRLFRFRHPVHELRRAILAGDTWSLPAPRACAVVVYRQNLVLGWKEVDELALSAIEALSSGKRLAAALDGLARRRPKDADRLEASVGGYFREWVEDGWIRDLST